jgi:hypothetical protein
MIATIQITIAVPAIALVLPGIRPPGHASARATAGCKMAAVIAPMKTKVILLMKITSTT